MCTGGNVIRAEGSKMRVLKVRGTWVGGRGDEEPSQNG